MVELCRRTRRPWAKPIDREYEKCEEQLEEFDARIKQIKEKMGEIKERGAGLEQEQKQLRADLAALCEVPEELKPVIDVSRQVLEGLNVAAQVQVQGLLEAMAAVIQAGRAGQGSRPRTPREGASTRHSSLIG